jgi:hypothetical protein
LAALHLLVALLLTQVTALNRATQRSETFTGHYLLSTLPLGVLKAKYGSIFAGGVDSAAAARKEAISALGMGLLNKVSSVQTSCCGYHQQSVCDLQCQCRECSLGGDGGGMCARQCIARQLT